MPFTIRMDAHNMDPARLRKFARNEVLLYRVLGEPGLLYIGRTASPDQRFMIHRASTEWWADAQIVALTRIGDLFDRGKAIEARAIRSEAPLHNRIHNWRRFRPSRPTPGRGPCVYVPVDQEP